MENINNESIVIEYYRNRIIEDLYLDIPKRIKERMDQINKAMRTKNEDEIDFEKYIKNIIINILDIEDDFSPPVTSSDKIANNIRNNRNYRVKKLMEEFNQDKLLYEKGSENSELSLKTPFSAIQVTSNTTGADEQELYNTYVEQVEEWKRKITSKRFTSSMDMSVDDLTNKITFVSDYPFFYLYKAKDKLAMIKLDIEQFLILLIGIKKYKNYAMIHPTYVDQKGVFIEGGLRTNNKERVNPNLTLSDSSPLTVSLKMMEPGTTKLWNFYVWDDKDSVVINYLCTKAISQMQLQNESVVSNNFTVSGHLVDICHLIWQNRSRYNTDHYTRASNLLKNLTGVRFIAKDEAGADSVYPVFDDVTVNDKLFLYEVSLGSRTAKTIIGRQYTTIFMDQYENLEDSIARLLYQAIKKDRLFDLITIGNNDKRVVHNYSIETLTLIVRPVGSKKEKKAKFLAAFNELANKGTLVRSVEVRNGGTLFVVEWLPITMNERQDLVIRDDIMLLENHEFNQQLSLELDVEKS